MDPVNQPSNSMCLAYELYISCQLMWKSSDWLRWLLIEKDLSIMQLNQKVIDNLVKMSEKYN
jgi:hypothetical protein